MAAPRRDPSRLEGKINVPGSKIKLLDHTPHNVLVRTGAPEPSRHLIGRPGKSLKEDAIGRARKSK